MWDSYKKEQDHPYTDFEAWERWMTEKSSGPGMEHWETAWDALDTLERIGLYSIMCDTLARTKETNEQRITSKNAVHRH